LHRHPKILGACATLLVMLVLVAGYKEVLEDRLFPKRFGVVEANQIYRSAQLDPALVRDVLEQYGIKVVVDLQYWEDKPGHLAELEAVNSLHIKQYRFPLEDK
jgi:hypothetical protein